MTDFSKRIKEAAEILEIIQDGKEFYHLHEKKGYIEKVTLDGSVQVRTGSGEHSDYVCIPVKTASVKHDYFLSNCGGWHNLKDIRSYSKEGITQKMLDESYRRLTTWDGYKQKDLTDYDLESYVYQVDMGMKKIDKFEAALEEYLEGIKQKELNKLKGKRY